jgi:hypothetical protein
MKLIGDGFKPVEQSLPNNAAAENQPSIYMMQFM